MKGFLIAAASVMLSLSVYASPDSVSVVARQGVHLMATIPADKASDAEYVERALRGVCGEAYVCVAHVWKRGDSVPKKFPMSDSEMASEIGTYQQNRHTGHKAVMLSCQRFKAVPKDRCF